MSRFNQKALLYLLLVGLVAPAMAQISAVPVQYHRSAVAEADWPEAVMCGEAFTVDVTMINTNPRTRWTEAGYHKLGPIKGEDEVFRPDGHKVKMPDGTEVPFRGQHTFNLELTAPEKEGTYETHWSMMAEGTPYGTTISREIRVSCDHAELGRALFPEEVACGESFTAQVRMRNTGKSAWTEAKFYKLGPLMGTDEVFRADGEKVKMPDGTEVVPGDKYAFELELMAPPRPGTYETKWVMMKGGNPFGEEISRTIKVNCEGMTKEEMAKESEIESARERFLRKEEMRKDGRDN